MEPAPTGDQLEQTVVEDKLTESTNQNQAVNNQSETNLSHSEEPHPLDKDQNHDKLLLTRGQDFDLDYTLLGNGSKIITVPILQTESRKIECQLNVIPMNYGG